MRERMGSGGPRGLQILRSGVSVRGGFDSHAFPPFFAACALWVVLASAVHAQAATPRDSAAVVVARDSARVEEPVEPSPADAAAVREAAIVTTPPRARRTLPTPGRFDQPRWVMLRSLLVPGWGQVHNRAWIKAALVVAGDGALRARFFRDERRLRGLNRDAAGRLGDLNGAIGDTTAAGAEYRAAVLSGDPQRIDAAQAAVTSANLRLNAASGAYNTVVSAYNALLETSINRRWLVGGVVLYALIDAYVDAHFKNFDVNLQFDPALPGGTGAPGARLQIRWAF